MARQCTLTSQMLLQLALALIVPRGATSLSGVLLNDRI